MRGWPRLPSIEFEQGGFFPADVSAGAQVGVDVQGVIRAKELFAQEAGFLHLCDPFIQEGCHWPELTAQVDVGSIGPGGIAAIATPSRNWKGLLSMISRSLKVPGSNSSALATT